MTKLTINRDYYNQIMRDDTWKFLAIDKKTGKIEFYKENELDDLLEKDVEECNYEAFKEYCFYCDKYELLYNRDDFEKKYLPVVEKLEEKEEFYK